MRYFGGKARIANDLSRYLNSQLKDGQTFVDMFCGSCNVVSKIASANKIANDKHRYLIAMWNALQEGWLPPARITKEDYLNIKQNKDINPALTGFVGFGMSFGGKWFGGFTGEISKNGQDYLKCASNGVFKKLKGMVGVRFTNLDYKEVVVPEESLIYCDIPYKGTTPYCKSEVGSFNHEEFYDWCRGMVDKGMDIFVSEYESNVPKDAVIVWRKESGTTNAAWRGSAKKTVEVLYKFTKENRCTSISTTQTI